MAGITGTGCRGGNRTGHETDRAEPENKEGAKWQKSTDHPRVIF
jgi:hypothetical protein